MITRLCHQHIRKVLIRRICLANYLIRPTTSCRRQQNQERVCTQHNVFVTVITRTRDAGSPARHQQSAPTSIPITLPDHGFQNKQRRNRVCR